MAELVSICITHFNRPEALRNAIDKINLHIRPNYSSIEVLVADDGSSQENVAEIKKLEGIDNLILNSHIGGGSNNNTLLKAASGNYLLWNQDDCQCIGYNDFLEDAIKLLEMPNVGLVRFSGFEGDSHTCSRVDSLPENIKCSYTTLKGEYNGLPYWEIVRDYKRVASGRNDLKTLYSDHPHLKTKEFVEKFGMYKEGSSIWRSETDYVERFWNSNYRSLIWGQAIVVAGYHSTKSLLDPKELRRIEVDML